MKQEQFTYTTIKSLFYIEGNKMNTLPSLAEEENGLIFYVRNWDYLLSYDDKGVWIRS